MKLRIALAIIALLLVPSVAAQDIARDAVLSHSLDLSFSPSDFTTTCQAGAIIVDADGRGFTFYEGTDEDVDNAPYDQGMTAAGCGVVRRPIDVPSGTSDIRVHFVASREVTTFSVITAGSPLEQEVQILNADGDILQTRPVFQPTAPGRPETPQELIQLGGLDGQGFVEWSFRDGGFATQAEAPNPASGQALRGTVRDAVVHFDGMVPEANLSQATERARDGTTITTLHRVTVPVAAGLHGIPAASLRVLPDLDLVDVLAPGGQSLGAGRTFDGGVAVHQDTEDVLLEIQDAYLRVTVPHALTQAHGDGDYMFVFQERAVVQVSPALVPLSILLLAAPLPFAALAFVEARAFAQEAFGAYARSARNLQVAVALVITYYAAVVISALVGRRLTLMAIWPMPLEGVLLYVQVFLAGVGFTALWLVARELYLLVRPSISDDAL